MQTPRALVTGSSGTIGAAVARELRAGGWQVRGLDVRPGPETTVVGDVREQAVRTHAVAGVRDVVHTAALHAPHVGRVPDALFHELNVEATAELLNSLGDAGGCRFVLTSSTSVYGDALIPVDRAVWVTEELPPRPRDVYDETKRAAELALSAPSSGPPGLTTLALRIARCFPEPLLLRAVHRLHRGVALADVARAHRLALERPEITGVLNIAGPLVFEPADTHALWTDAPTALATRAPQLAALFREQGWPLPARLDRVYASTRAAALLGYHPRYGAEALGEGTEG